MHTVLLFLRCDDTIDQLDISMVFLQQVLRQTAGMHTQDHLKVIIAQLMLHIFAYLFYPRHFPGHQLILPTTLMLFVCSNARQHRRLCPVFLALNELLK